MDLKLLKNVIISNRDQLLKAIRVTAINRNDDDRPLERISLGEIYQKDLILIMSLAKLTMMELRLGEDDMILLDDEDENV